MDAFTPAERTLLFKLIEELTGATTQGDSRHESLINNVERRMVTIGVRRLQDYLDLVKKDSKELAHLVSALTIHTTSWFRENPHFVAFQEILLEAVKKNEVFKVWCAACSTGEEVYSFALLLEEFRRVHPTFDYEILGTDIDALSVAVAERAIYNKKNMDFHVIRYKNHVLEGSGKTQEFFTLSKAIRDRCKFRVHDLRQAVAQKEGPFHVCICRNVLIYFSPETVGRVITHLMTNVRIDGYLMLGHSESVNGAEFGLSQMGHSVYSKRSPEATRKSTGKYRILIVDDSATTRKFLSKQLEEMGFDAVTASNSSEATNYLNFNEVDLITLDLKMPDITGDKWLARERGEGMNTPVVVISDAHAADAKEVVGILAMGAQDYLEKEVLRTDPKRLKDIFLELIRAHGKKPPTSPKAGRSLPTQRPDLIMIGASTGGPQALVRLLQDMPKNSPPILITQHMSPKFMRPLAERIAEASGLKLGSADDRTPMLPGHVYMSLGDYHVSIEETRGQLLLRTSTAQPFNGHRPSVDYMYNSALGYKGNVMGILLTGMGRDGALGLRFLRKEGAFCVAQSEEDCIVYGMPKEAIERDAADFVGTIEEIRTMMRDALKLMKSGAA